MGILDLFYDLTARLFERDDILVHEPSSHAGEPAPAAIPHMPAELVLTILEAVQADESPAETQNTLAACALVCKDWSVAAQRLLFRRVALDSMPALEGFLGAVSAGTPRARSLAGTVEALHCVIDAKQPRGLTQHAFARAVLACPRLAALSLAVYGDISASPAQGERSCTKPSSLLFDEQILSLLHTAGPPITALRFDNWSHNAHALPQLLAAFPSITSLDIGGCTPVLPAPTPAPPAALTQLRMSVRTSPAPEFTHWLLRSSRLHTLEFTNSPAPQLLEDLLVDHGSTLESLALPSCASLECTNALALCTRLTKLRLESLWAAPNAARTLPASLTHLAFALDADAALAPVLAAVRGGALQSVRVHARARHAQLPDLRIACAMHGVALRSASSIQALRA